MLVQVRNHCPITWFLLGLVVVGSRRERSGHPSTPEAVPHQMPSHHATRRCLGRPSTCPAAGTLLRFSWAMCHFISFSENYNDLYQWSVESYSDFWAEFWKFSGIVYSRMYDEVSREFAYRLSLHGYILRWRINFWDFKPYLLWKPHIGGESHFSRDLAGSRAGVTDPTKPVPPLGPWTRVDSGPVLRPWRP